MEYEGKSREELLGDLVKLTRKIREFESLEKEYNLSEESLREANQALRALIQASPLAIISLDPEGKVILWNPAAENIFGWAQQEALGKVLPIVPPEKLEEFRALCGRVLNGENLSGVEAMRQRKDGSSVYINIFAAPLYDEKGEVCGIMGIVSDITERKIIEEALKMSKEHFRSLVESSPDCVCRISLDGKLMSINSSGCLLNGFDKPEDAVGTCYCNAAAEHKQQLEDAFKKALIGETASLQYRSVTLKGDEIWWDTKLTPIRGSDGAIKSILQISRDITERKKTEQRQESISAGLHAIVEVADELIACEDEDCLFKMAVEFAREKLGLERSAIFIEDGGYLKGTYGTDRSGHTTDEHNQRFPKDQRWSERLRMLKPKDPQWFVVEEAHLEWDGERTIQLGKGWIAITPIQSAHRPVGVFVNDTEISRAGLDTVKQEINAVFCSLLGNITERKRAEAKSEILYRELRKSSAKLKHLALRDSQTGLYNHRYLGEAVETEMDRAKRSGFPLSVIMMDIDYFKSINDVYGHQFGDLVLRQLAGQLKKTVRRYDIIIRFGGEEFIIISPGIDRMKAVILANRILDNVNLHNFGNKKHAVKLKISLAVSSYPEDKVVRSMGLVELADQILNKVKEYGGNRVFSSVDVKSLRHPSDKKKSEGINIKYLKEKLERLNKRANQSLIEAIFAFAKTLKLKDYYTGEHSEKTVQYATEIAKELNLPKDQMQLIREAAILHDLGKIGISEKILLKKSKLTKPEFNEIKKHPEIGVDIIRPIHFLHGIIPFMLYHHERWDGKGYPNGLKGEEIPVGARIIAVADTYQALISDRPYRKAYPAQEAMQIVKDGAGSQFDHKIVEIFLKVLAREKERKFISRREK